MAQAHGRDTRPGANQYGGRLEPVHQRHGAIENLGWRLVHDGGWIRIEPLAHVAGNAHNFGHSRLVAGSQPGTDDDGLPDRVGIRPVLACHGLADHYGSARLRVMQESAGKQWNAQDVEAVRRNDAPLDIAGGEVALKMPPSGG